MSDTKTAIAAVLALTLDRDHGPVWLGALIAAMQLIATVWLVWYLWRGPEPVERKVRR